MRLLAHVRAAAGGRARQAETQPYARVIVETARVRTGPGASYRRLHMAQRDEVFPMRARATQGYWFLVELPDSTCGFIPATRVQPRSQRRARERGRFLPWLFAPPPLPGAHGEIAVIGGVLGGGGMLAVRPALLARSRVRFRAQCDGVVAPGGRLLIATAGPIVNLLPSSPMVPFATLQGGVTASSPNADTFLLAPGSVATLGAGAGLRFGFRYRDHAAAGGARARVLRADRTVTQEEFSAGLTVFF